MFFRVVIYMLFILLFGKFLSSFYYFFHIEVLISRSVKTSKFPKILESINSPELIKCNYPLKLSIYLNQIAQRPLEVILGNYTARYSYLTAKAYGSLIYS